MAKRSGFRVSHTSKDRDFRQVLKLLDSDWHIKLGIFGAKGEAKHKDSEETVVEIMSRHEFGLGVPERSFLRAFIDESRKMIAQDIRAVLRRAIVSGTVEPGLKLLGQKYEGLIKQRISQGIPPPNAQSTIKRKGSSKPLIDTGQGRASITNEVGKGAKVKGAEKGAKVK